ncbi:cbb3-type cytochrome c oxidase N-terminal domain-containing protein [Pedobacter insulae]|uniref:Cytochrome c oxidase cbb3-type subunit 3 n=1 Tax=Pedobacter insulae TaxID=414048 RepID=A0A1I3A0S6_9SPHI|nr:cbb3-type cytochrome c oxidase N-terminal domain-containing protein [Pedobacter insulae]SFH43762.1 cytochrome c oxidase cbb3-type subunit 3 [Pedobacter insulae]
MKKISLISATPLADAPTIGLTSTELLIAALFVFALVALLATFIMLKALKVMIKEGDKPMPLVKEHQPGPLDYLEWAKLKKAKPNVWSKLLSLKPIEEEQTLLIPHAYDGIHELNNPVPKWFSILFYATIIFAGGYLYYYHIGNGPMQDQEYVAEIEKAAKDKRAFLANAAEKFDENSIKLDGSMIANGKAVFMTNCVACHGDQGQGTVGPNLTDEFWLHGGSISDIFKTVKYGVSAKGMASWEKNLSSKNIAEVVNYIMSLKGSKPANPKAPQGEKYEDKSVKDTVTNESIAKN